MVGLAYEKNYQIWHHRRCIAELLGTKLDTKAEMNFLKMIFDSDCKNFHAWSYRTWAVERFQLFDGEFDFTEKLLDNDVTNNSVWVYRNFILNKAPRNLLPSDLQHRVGTEPFVRAEILRCFKRIN